MNTAYDVARQTFAILLPEILLLTAATVMVTAGAFFKLPRRTWCASAAVTMGVALIVLLGIDHPSADTYASVVLNDALGNYGRILFLLTGLIVLALAHDQVDEGRAPEYFASLLFINAGAMLVAVSNELIFLFLGLELISIPTYLLLYLSRRNQTTQEAATKYFFLSIFSSGLLLFGFAYLYGLTGISNLKAIAYLVTGLDGVPQPQFALIAVVFIVAGLGFRVATVPFHFYAPDVYEGSPTVIAGLLSWLPKAIGFFAMIRTVVAIVAANATEGALSNQAVLLAWVIAAATMTLGNTVALVQDNLKRLLAYSSIAHAGYLMIGIAVACQGDANAGIGFHGAEAILFYLTSYAFMTLGVFGVIILLSTKERPIERVDDLAGLGWTHPGWALIMAISLFSLAGIPPFVGFLGKFELFFSAFSVTNAEGGGLFWWLAIVGVLNSAIGAYYYLRIVVTMYLRQPTGEAIQAKPAWPTATAVIICGAFSVVFSVYPMPIMKATRVAAVSSVALPDPSATPGPVLAGSTTTPGR